MECKRNQGVKNHFKFLTLEMQRLTLPFVEVGETTGKAGWEKVMQVWFRHVTFGMTMKPPSRGAKQAAGYKNQEFSRDVRTGDKCESHQHRAGVKAMRLGGITQEVNYPTVIFMGFSKENNNKKQNKMRRGLTKGK